MTIVYDGKDGIKIAKNIIGLAIRNGVAEIIIENEMNNKYIPISDIISIIN